MQASPPSLHNVLHPLAVSLSQQEWTRAAIRLHLSLRLPSSLARLAPSMALKLTRAFPKTTAPDPSTLFAYLRTGSDAQRLVRHARQTGQIPAPVLTQPTFRPDATLCRIPIPALATTDHLADWLGLTPGQLTRFADLRGLSAFTDNAFAPHYHQHLLPKKNGTLRLIEEPKPFLKTLQRRILHGILDLIPPHAAAYGFRTGRNCIQGAARHAGEQIVLGFDLADFFPRIPYIRIYSLFRTLGYPQQVARHLTGLCTALTPPEILRTPILAARDPLTNRHLPQGAPTSPALANLCALALDRRLSGLARSLGATYTRYADDLTFSGDTRIAPILHHALPRITSEEGFTLNPCKTRQARAHQRQIVTGLIVNQTPNIPRPAYDLIKATIHHLSNPVDPRRADPAFIARLSGSIAWVEQVNPARALRLRQRLHAALA